MKHHPILEGAYARDFFHPAARRTTTIVRSFPILLAIVGLVVMSGCAGIGKPSTMTGIAMEVTPNPLDFGTVMVGTSSTQTLTVSNSGSVKFTLTKVSASGKGFTISGLSAPETLVPGKSIKLTVVFKPTSAAQESSNLLVAINTQSPHTAGNLKGTGSNSLLSVTPSVVGFGNVSVGSPVTQPLRLTNGGSKSVVIKSVSATGSGFSISGLVTPQTLTPGESVNFTAEFNPKSAGTETGTISIATESTPVSVGLNGVGVSSAAKLVASTTSLSFGNVMIGESPFQQVTLKNTGNASADISSVSVTGSSYTLGGVTSKVTLAPDQSAILTVEFGPKTKGSLPGKVTISSNAPGSPVVIQLSGTGMQEGQQQSVALSWDESQAQVVGYFVYRSSKSSGPYSKLNAEANVDTTYTDSSVASGQKYFYVVTAVSSENIESSFSNPVSVTIPLQ
jgi:HYDIN/CFA65/VesB family protein/centrosomal CEP192-like protein/ASPM-SPD-2-Hydin domain-containing protein